MFVDPITVVTIITGLLLHLNNFSKNFIKHLVRKALLVFNPANDLINIPVHFSYGLAMPVFILVLLPFKKIINNAGGDLPAVLNGFIYVSLSGNSIADGKDIIKSFYQACFRIGNFKNLVLPGKPFYFFWNTPNR